MKLLIIVLQYIIDQIYSWAHIAGDIMTKK